MIAKLEWTQSNAQQNIEQLQNPTMGVTNNNKSQPLQFNNKITLHIISLHCNTDIDLGQDKQQQK